MSQFSNPAGNATSAAGSYTAALLEVLGDRDPLAVMNDTAPLLTELIAGLTPESIREPEGPGKWSALQVLEHVADTELVYGYRFRLPVAQDQPVITGFDQEAWVQRLWGGNESAADALDQFAALRRINLRFLRQLTQNEWDREGMHSERGAESVRLMVRLGAAHDLVHTAQLRRILKAGDRS